MNIMPWGQIFSRYKKTAGFNLHYFTGTGAFFFTPDKHSCWANAPVPPIFSFLPRGALTKHNPESVSSLTCAADESDQGWLQESPTAAGLECLPLFRLKRHIEWIADQDYLPGKIWYADQVGFAQGQISFA